MFIYYIDKTYETVSEVSFMEDPGEVDVSATEMAAALKPRKHRDVSLREAKFPNNDNLLQMSKPPPVNPPTHRAQKPQLDYANAVSKNLCKHDRMEADAPATRSNKSPMNRYQDEVLHGTGSGTGMKAVPPNNQRGNQKMEADAPAPRSGKSMLNRRQDEVLHGTGSGTGLKAVPPKNQHGNQRDRDTKVSHITGLFVSRLDPKTSARQVQSMIKRETGMSAQPERLPTKFDTYSSFYIRGDKFMQDTLMCADLWPKYTLVKRYFERY